MTSLIVAAFFLGIAYGMWFVTHYEFLDGEFVFKNVKSPARGDRALKH